MNLPQKHKYISTLYAYFLRYNTDLSILHFFFFFFFFFGVKEFLPVEDQEEGLWKIILSTNLQKNTGLLLRRRRPGWWWGGGGGGFFTLSLPGHRGWRRLMALPVESDTGWPVIASSAGGWRLLLLLWRGRAR